MDVQPLLKGIVMHIIMALWS